MATEQGGSGGGGGGLVAASYVSLTCHSISGDGSGDEILRPLKVTGREGADSPEDLRDLVEGAEGPELLEEIVEGLEELVESLADSREPEA